MRSTTPSRALHGAFSFTSPLPTSSSRLGGAGGRHSDHPLSPFFSPSDFMTMTPSKLDDSIWNDADPLGFNSISTGNTPLKKRPVSPHVNLISSSAVKFGGLSREFLTDTDANMPLDKSTGGGAAASAAAATNASLAASFDQSFKEEQDSYHGARTLSLPSPPPTPPPRVKLQDVTNQRNTSAAEKPSQQEQPREKNLTKPMTPRHQEDSEDLQKQQKDSQSFTAVSENNEDNNNTKQKEVKSRNGDIVMSTPYTNTTQNFNMVTCSGPSRHLSTDGDNSSAQRSSSHSPPSSSEPKRELFKNDCESTSNNGLTTQQQQQRNNSLDLSTHHMDSIKSPNGDHFGSPIYVRSSVDV